MYFLLLFLVFLLALNAHSRSKVSKKNFDKLFSLLEKKGYVTKEEFYGKAVPKKNTNSAPVVSENGAFKGIPAEKTVVKESSRSFSEIPLTPKKILEKKPEQHFEFKFSSNILTIVGVVAVLLGVGFFLKYSFENNLIGETGRVILGILSGFVFLGLGEFLSKKYSKYSQMLSGGGIALLYLSLYGVLYYNLLSDLPVFMFMAIVTAASLLLSVRYDAKSIAGIGVFGGFLTPVFFGSMINVGIGEFVVLNYIVVLNLGILALAYFKDWRVMMWGSFAGTVILVSSWFSVFFSDEKLWLTEIYLTILWLVFTFSSLIFYYFKKRSPNMIDFAFIVVVGISYVALAYGALVQVFGSDLEYAGILPFLVALVYIWIAYLGAVLRKDEIKLMLFPMGMAVLFVTLIFPIQFDGQWVTVSWFVEAVVVGVIAYLIRNKNLLFATVPIYGVALISLFSTPIKYSYLSAITPIFNERFFLYLLAIFSAFFIVRIFHKAKYVIEDSSIGGVRSPGMFFFAAANLLIATLLFMEIGVYDRFISSPFHNFVPLFNPIFFLFILAVIYAYAVVYILFKMEFFVSELTEKVRAIFFTAANVLIFIAGSTEIGNYYRFLEDYIPFFNARTIILILWASYAGGIAYFLYKKPFILANGADVIRNVFFFVFNIVLFIFGVYEIADYYRFFEDYNVLFNNRALIFVLWALYAFGMSYFFYKKFINSSEIAIKIGNIFFAAANVLIILFGILEIVDYYKYISTAAKTSQIQNMMISLYLALYGFIALIIGIFTRCGLLRKIAITVLSVTIFKVFLVDVWILSEIYRVVAFLFLGVTLLIVGYLYYRYKDRITMFLKAEENLNIKDEQIDEKVI